jgi:cell division protein FtsN
MARRAESRQMKLRHARGGFFLGVVLGLIIGLGIALGVAYYINKTPIPFSPRAKADAKDSASKASSIAGMPQGSVTLPTFSATTPSEKPRYDFYKILPGGEEQTTGKPASTTARSTTAPAASASATPAPRPALTTEPYYIQVGSFQNPSDADNHKARLAIIGLESSVEPTTLPDKGTWYRVRIGPFTKLEDINRVRQVLAQNGIKSTLVKAKTGPVSKAN